MTRIIDKFVQVIDSINCWIGKCTAFLIPIIMAIASFEVFMRYVCNTPTIWAWDVNTQLLAIVVFLMGAYTLQTDGHVNIDLFYGRLSRKGKARANLITAPIFLIFFSVLLWKTSGMTFRSIKELELMSTIFAPPLYPMKIIITIGLFMFLMQGIVKIIKDVRIILNDKES